MGNVSNKGGLRTKGILKEPYENKPLITIVTVVYNGASYLEDTILSVINQTYDNIEYIIIDGGSTDGTLDIIKKYESKIDYWVSEPDDGIYDAMNKGIDLATGAWINFMNAGDSFIDKEIVNEIFRDQYQNIDVIYGDTLYKYDENNLKYLKAKLLKYFYKGLPFCHQSVFVTTLLMKERKFNIKYKICADFDFFWDLYCDNKQFFYLPMMIAKYDGNGISSLSIFKTWREKKEIVLKNSKKYVLYYVVIYFELHVRYFLKKILPKWIVRKVQMSR